ncbi:MAG: hypothetical protein FJ025_02895 [Chloroflexi bacterium]|nr:hypothetical protein [Chloroflexota bacterium]
MSKLIDKLNWVSQTAPQPLGFRTAQPVAPKRKMLLIVSFAQTSAENLTDYIDGADAGLLHISSLSSGAKALQKISQATPDIPWGVRLKDSGTGEIKQLIKAGCDFIVFSAGTPLAMLQKEDVGKVLEVEPSLSEGLLRTLNELPADAVLIDGTQDGDSSLTWHHLMLFQRFAALLTKPLLASTPSDITDSELQALWDAGVDGIIIEVKAGQPAERLKELRQSIDKLTPAPRKRGKVEALLPRIAERAELATEEEEEEE